MADFGPSISPNILRFLWFFCSCSSNPSTVTTPSPIAYCILRFMLSAGSKLAKQVAEYLRTTLDRAEPGATRCLAPRRSSVCSWWVPGRRCSLASRPLRVLWRAVSFVHATVRAIVFRLISNSAAAFTCVIKSVVHSATIAHFSC